MSSKRIAEVQAARAFSLKIYPRAISHLVARALHVQDAQALDRPPSRGGMSTIAARFRARGDDAFQVGFAGTGAHHRWLEWAEAFMASVPPTDDGP